MQQLIWHYSPQDLIFINISLHYAALTILLGHSYNMYMKLVNNYKLLTMFPVVRGSADWPSQVIPYIAAGFGGIDRTPVSACSPER